MPPGAARPIMGERRLGERPIQESWDLALGTPPAGAHRARLRGRQHRAGAGAAPAPRGVRPARHRGDRPGGRRGRDAVPAQPPPRRRTGHPRAGGACRPNAASTAHRRCCAGSRRLLAHYRTSEPVLPSWIESFVKAGYAHYCTLLPTAFTDEDATVRQVAAMLGFLFSMESPGAVAGLRPDPAGTGRRPVASAGAGEDGAALGGTDQLGLLSRGRAAGAVRRTARQPPGGARLSRAISAASSMPWNPSRVWRLRRGDGVERVRAAAGPGAAALAARPDRHPAVGRRRAGPAPGPRGRADLPRPPRGPGRMGPAVAGTAGSGSRAYGAGPETPAGASPCSPPTPRRVTRWRPCSDLRIP